MGFWRDLFLKDYPERKRAEWVNQAIDAGFTILQAEFLFNQFNDSQDNSGSMALAMSSVAMSMAAASAAR